ncbi:MAG: hypothetical protein DME67_06365 [Verrucomicrobia bacterium]|nr:MAG: hypothetical protein DMF07_05975 [Verrucomicrobiota bacterium]PYK05096.1 MAG: hypothetical protein DME67_06365 [Verrucomicrobiota bacterium]
MLAVHLENLLFLLLLVVAGLFQLLGRAARKGSADEENPKSTPLPKARKPIPRAPIESDQERIRKFLEALGQPPASRPPPPVVARTDIPPRRLAPVQPPIAPLWELTRAEQRKRRVILRESPPLSTETRTKEIVTREIAGAQTFEIHEGPLSVEPPPITKTPPEAYATATPGLAKSEELEPHVPRLLVSTSGLRQAIILREILGPPRGLRMQMEFADGIS